MKGDVHFMMPQAVTHAAMRGPTRNVDVRREAAALSSHCPKVARSLKTDQNRNVDGVFGK